MSSFSHHTPRSFSAAFPGLLAGYYPTCHAVTLTLANPDTAGGGGEDEMMITVLATLFARPKAHSGSAPPALHTCHITAHAASLTAGWCTALQRCFSLAASLSTDETFSPTTGGGAGGTTTAAAGYDPLQEFHVLLFPFLPEMHYVLSLDGILGSQHGCVVSRRIPSGGDDDRKEDRGATGALGASQEGSQGAAGDAPAETQQQQQRWSKAPRTEAGGCMAAGRHGQYPHPSTGAAPPPLPSSSSPARAFTCRAAALLNANIPVPAEATAAGPGADPIVLVILHAPGRCLLSSTSASSSSSSPEYNSKGPVAATVSFDAIKRITTTAVTPRVSLSALRGSWRPHRTSLPSRSGGGGGGTADNVCGLASLGTSYLIYPAPTTTAAAAGRAWCGGRVKNIVLVLDAPMELWGRVHGGAAAAAAMEEGGTAAHLAALIDAALLQLVSENIDLFSFRSTGNGGTMASSALSSLLPGGGVGDRTTARSSALLSDDVLIRSIAESIVGIIGSSDNADFVAAAEAILFADGSSRNSGDSNTSDIRPERRHRAIGSKATTLTTTTSTAAAAGRYTPAELRWAIEEKLHRFHDKERK